MLLMFYNDSIHYTFSTGGFSISLNALGLDADSCNYTQCNTAGVHNLYVYIDEPSVGLEIFRKRDLGSANESDNIKAIHYAAVYDIKVYPTHFTTNDRLYVYAAIPRSQSSENEAVIVYPNKPVDVFGVSEIQNPDGSVVYEQANEDYYYIFLGGIISSPVEGQGRVWEQPIEQGAILGRITGDEAMSTRADGNVTQDYVDSALEKLRKWVEEHVAEFSKMFSFNKEKQAIEQHYPILVSAINTLILAGKKILGIATDETPDDDDDTLITTAQASKRFLSRKHDDTAEGNITLKKQLVVEGETHLKGNEYVSGDARFGKTAGSKIFNKDIIFGEGWQVDEQGNFVGDSMTLRKFAEFPELRYNRINVHVGVDWQTTGAGLIESVDTEKQIVTLKLEDGEFGTIQKGHLCMGIWHQMEGNDTETKDERNGNFHFAGFCTVYFEIVDFCNEDGSEILNTPDTEGKYNKKYFKYALREDWPSVHPCAMMQFAAYAHRTNPDYQWCAYQTPQYLILLSGMTDWTYDQKNIAYVRGWLKGFTIIRRNGTAVELKGIGIGTGRIYRWGTEIVIDRDPQLLTQQLLYLRSNLPLEDFAQAIPSYSSWSATPLSPDADNKYVYAYWLKTYDDGQTEIYVPSGKNPKRSDIFIAAMYGETGASALSARLSQDIIVLNTTTDDWEEDGIAPQLYMSNGTQHEIITAELYYGLDRETITKATIEERDGVKNVAITYNDGRAVIAFDIAEGINLVKNTVLAIILWSDRTDKDGYKTGITLAPSADGNDGNDGKAGQGVGNVVEEFVANEGEQPSADAVGFPTSSLAGYGEEQNVLWRRLTTYDTDNIIVSRTDWSVISRWGKNGKDGKPGEKGAVGSVMRPCGEFDPTTTYINETELDKDIKFIDVVLYFVEGEYHAFARTTDPYPMVNGKPYLMKPADDQCEDDSGIIIISSVIWLPADKYKFIATDLLLAENAFIKFLSGRAAFFTDKDGNIRLGLQGETVNPDGTRNPMIFAGANNNNANNAPFRVYEDGKLYSSDAKIEGEITATKGKIGSFLINADHIGVATVSYDDEGNQVVDDDIQGLFLYDNMIGFNNTGRQAIFGTWSNFGQSMMVRLTDTGRNPDNSNGYSPKYGIVFNIKDSYKANLAFCGVGNGALNGFIDGYGFSKLNLAQENTIYDINVTSNRVFVNAQFAGSGIILPRRAAVCEALSISEQTPFAFRFLVTCDLNSPNVFSVYGRNKLKNSSDKEAWNLEDYPLLTHWDNGNWDYRDLEPGDSLEVLLVYDPDRTDTIDGFSTKYTARTIHLQK